MRPTVQRTHLRSTMVQCCFRANITKYESKKGPTGQEYQSSCSIKTQKQVRVNEVNVRNTQNNIVIYVLCFLKGVLKVVYVVDF